ncbi:hypothetical protein NKG94_24075 [Micromonospora sp. M12]
MAGAPVVRRWPGPRSSDSGNLLDLAPDGVELGLAWSADLKYITTMPRLPRSAQTQMPSGTVWAVPAPQRASPPSGPASTATMLVTDRSLSSPAMASSSSFFGSASSPDAPAIMTRSRLAGSP